MHFTSDEASTCGLMHTLLQQLAWVLHACTLGAACLGPACMHSWTGLPGAGMPRLCCPPPAGGIHRVQRFPAWTGSPDQVGYNQVFEQLFQAYERKMPDEAMRDMRDDRSVMEWENIPYECPADRQLGLTFFMTPHKPYLDPFGFINEWSLAIGGVLVMAAVIGIGMFRWGRDCLCVWGDDCFWTDSLCRHVHL